MPLPARGRVLLAGHIGPHDARVGETCSLGVERLGKGPRPRGADGEVGLKALTGPGPGVVKLRRGWWLIGSRVRVRDPEAVAGHVGGAIPAHVEGHQVGGRAGVGPEGGGLVERVGWGPGG